MVKAIEFITIWVTLVFAICSAAVAQEINYFITIEEENPLVASVVLEIFDHNRELELYSRAPSLQTTTQVRDVRCGNRSLSKNGIGNWVVPVSCNKVSWSVDIGTESDQGIPAYEQKTIMSKSGRWWIFATPTAILRLTNEPDVMNILFDVPFQENSEATIPSSLKAPGFYPVGDVPKLMFKNSNINLVYISDNPELTSQFVKPEDHAKALEYLSKVMGIDPGIERDITMILLGITRQFQSLGGAAGDKTMLVNYIFDSKSPTSKEVYYPIIIAIHEQIHQLSRGPHLTWVSESLAQFYATKAALLIYPDNPQVKEIVDEVYASDPEGELGLVEIQKRIDRLQDYSNYDNFYNQGSAFWNELDILIQEASRGNESLDDYMPKIMSLRFMQGQGLPREVRRDLSFVGEGNIRALEEKYLFARN